MSKTAFVLKQGSIPAAEVVAKAKAAGMTLTPGHVYQIRSAHKRDSAKRAPAKVAGGKVAAAEAEFVRVATDIGLARAEALLGQIRKAVA